ncbi:MAG: hypothetical protein D6729_07535, partial [Deltaproteobacteria bacterium]
MRRLLLPAVLLLVVAGGLVAAYFLLAAPVPSPGEAPRLAVLSRTFGDVQWRRARTLAWEAGKAGLALQENDAVRTGEAARAVVDFDVGLTLDVDPRSLLIIRPLRREVGGRQVQDIVVDAGTVHGRFEESGPAQRAVQIVTDEGKVAARLVPEATGKPIRYRIRRSATGAEIALLEGRATLEAGGRELSLSAGQAVDVRTKGTARPGISEVHTLPPFPESLRPAVDESFPPAEDGARPAIDFAWAPVPEAKRYHLQVGRSFGFEEVVEDVTTEATEHRWTPPETGVWYWRVASLDADGREGEFGYVRRFTLLDEAAAEAPAAAEGEEGSEEAPPELETTGGRATLTGHLLGRGLERRPPGQGAFRPAKRRFRIAAGERWRATAAAGVRLGKGAALTLSEGSEVEVSKIGTHGGKQAAVFSVQSGALGARLRPAAQVGLLRIEGGAGRMVAAAGEEDVRARAEVHADGTFRAVVEAGRVEVYGGGRRQRVVGGQALDVHPDGRMGTPVPLPPRPT